MVRGQAAEVKVAVKDQITYLNKTDEVVAR
jgi:hypothetical protein